MFSSRFHIAIDNRIDILTLFDIQKDKTKQKQNKKNRSNSDLCQSQSLDVFERNCMRRKNRIKLCSFFHAWQSAFMHSTCFFVFSLFFASCFFLHMALAAVCHWSRHVPARIYAFALAQWLLLCIAELLLSQHVETRWDVQSQTDMCKLRHIILRKCSGLVDFFRRRHIATNAAAWNKKDKRVSQKI